MAWDKTGTLTPKAPGVTPQHWSDAPIDQSAAVQALIDQAVNPSWPWGRRVSLPPGVFYGSFKMRGDVILEGDGWGTTLKAMPGQSVPILDYETYEAYHTTLRDLRVDGNYVPGRIDGYADATCRCIHMDDLSSAGDEAAIQQFIFNQGGAASDTGGPGAANIIEDGNTVNGATQVWSTKWNDPANRIHNVFVTNSGGDWAVYVGINQRGAWVSDLFINKSKLGSLKNIATDTQFSNIQAGTSSYGIFVGGTNQQWTQCKSWYVGKNAGYNTAAGAGADQKPNGWTVSIPSTTLSQVRMINCEGQDNAGHDLALLQSVGSIIKDFLSGGAGDGLYLSGTSQFNDIQIDFGGADLTGDTTLITLDGANAKNNQIDWTANDAVLAASTVYSTINGGNLTFNNIRTFDGNGVDIQTFIASGTATPHALTCALTLSADATVQAPDLLGLEQFAYGDRLTIGVWGVGGDRTVSWAAAYNGVAATVVPMNAYKVFTFVWLGNWWLDADPQPQHQGTLGYGLQAVTEGRAYSANVTVAAITLYTAPADVSFTLFPLVYFYNPTGASITVTVKVAGVTVYTAAVGTLGTGQKANLPPLRPGDTITVSGSAAGLTAYCVYFECRDPSWKVGFAQPAANAAATLYTAPAGKKARGVYAANNLNPMWAVAPTAANGIPVFTPSGGAAIQIGSAALAVNASAILIPLLLELYSGDSIGILSTVAGATVWSLVQEY